MAFNITGFDPEVFYTINSTLQVVLFVVFHVPAIILNVLCIGALLLIKTVNWHIRATLTNILAAEIVTSISVSFFNIGYPIRVSIGNEFDYSCIIGLGLVVLGFLSNTTAVALYAITVYVFLKCGLRNLKWYVRTGGCCHWTLDSVHHPYRIYHNTNLACISQ